MEGVDLDTQKICILQLETFNTYELSRIEFFFNDLIRRIIYSRERLNLLNKTLEQKVAQRTQQLYEKQQALEQVNLELEQQISIVEQLVITDELTQLYNRRYFNRIFPKEIQRAAREKQVISFLIFDVDHFKQYNDYYGHQKGDSVLQTIGEVLKVQCQRASDIPLRLGGEEFGIIFSGLNNGSILFFAERVRLAIADTKIEHRFSSTADIVTASFGLVSVQATPDLTMDELYKQADEALYQAKETGRNKVVQVPKLITHQHT
jgi:diguanylate cyclase (GGDEF)-like protein